MKEKLEAFFLRYTSNPSMDTLINLNSIEDMNSIWAAAFFNPTPATTII